MVPLISALLVGGGLFAIALGLSSKIRQRHDALRSLLEAELAEGSAKPEALTELMGKAGMFAERVLSRTSASGRIELALSRAGWSLRSGEFVAVVGVTAIALGGFAWLITQHALVAPAVAALTAAAFFSIVQRKAVARVRAIEEQLPTILQLLSGSLDAGSSVLHAFEVVVEEGDPPLSKEFARVVAETKVGRPLLESLDALASRIGSHDLDWTVEAIRIQHTTGGKLADTLRVLADFMRARLEVRGEVRALSAEARLSAKVLTALPIVIGLFFFFFRRGYFEPLYTTGVGKGMLIAGAVGIVAGSIWMRRLVRVEV